MGSLVALSSPEQLEALGLTLSSTPAEFFEIVKGRMSSKNHAALDAIVEGLQDEHLCVTVGSLINIPFNSLQELVIEAGGKAGWVSTFEFLLGARFQRLGPGVPPSATLALPPPSAPPLSSGSSCGGERATRFEQENLGTQLAQDGRLRDLKVPIARCRAAVTECRDPLTGQLSWNDKRAVLGTV